MSKEIKERKQSAPKTIKVKTLVIGIAVTLAIIASFIGGWVARSTDQNRVQAEASALVSQLKISE